MVPSDHQIGNVDPRAPIIYENSVYVEDQQQSCDDEEQDDVLSDEDQSFDGEVEQVLQGQ